MFTIWTNVAITRRKSFFIITDPTGKTVYRDRHFWPCVEWLFIEEIEAYDIRASEPTPSDRVELLSVMKENMKWQKQPPRC